MYKGKKKRETQAVNRRRENATGVALTIDNKEIVEGYFGTIFPSLRLSIGAMHSIMTREDDTV